MFKLTIYPVILLTLLNFTPRSIQAAQLSPNICHSFAGLNCSGEAFQKDWLALSWGDLFKWLGRHRGAKGIRTPPNNSQSFYCLITPGKLEDSANLLKKTTSTVWHRKPLFLWQGKMSKIQVYAHGQAEPLWIRSLNEDDRYVIYDGPVLRPNKLGYYWQLEVKYPDAKTNSNTSPRKSFTIMNDTQTEELNQRLQEIDQQTVSPMERAKQRIRVFREEQFGIRADSALSGDILRELYTLEPLPPELATLKNNDFCSDKAEEPVTS